VLGFKVVELQRLGSWGSGKRRRDHLKILDPMKKERIE
jgi:hypothetical protein